MDYETTIGLRYLRSKRKEAFISFTTWISVVGIAIGVMAIIVVIAVMTGFQDEIRARILGINPHVLVMDVNGELRNPAEIVAKIKKVDGVSEAFPFTAFQAMVQNGKQFSGVAIKGIDPKDARFLSKLVKEGSVDVMQKKGSVLVGKELAKHLGLFVGDSFTIMVPFGGFSPMGSMPETIRARVGGIFETGMYEIDNTLVVMSLADVESAMGVGPTGIEIKLTDEYRAGELKWTILKALGRDYFARTWMEMNRNLFSALKLEKLAMFIILALIILGGELQHHQLPHHDGHGEEKGHRHIEIHWSEKAKHHEDLHDGRHHDRCRRRPFWFRHGLFPLLDHQEHGAHQASRGCLLHNDTASQDQHRRCGSHCPRHNGDMRPRNDLPLLQGGKDRPRGDPAL